MKTKPPPPGTTPFGEPLRKAQATASTTLQLPPDMIDANATVLVANAGMFSLFRLTPSQGCPEGDFLHLGTCRSYDTATRLLGALTGGGRTNG